MTLWDDYMDIYDYLELVGTDGCEIRVTYESKRSDTICEVSGPVLRSHWNRGLIRLIKFDPSQRKHEYVVYAIEENGDESQELRIDLLDNSETDNVVGKLRDIEIISGDQ